MVCIKQKRVGKLIKYMHLAEKEGFEPSVGSPLRLISSQVHSTTLPLLRVKYLSTGDSNHHPSHQKQVKHATQQHHPYKTAVHQAHGCFRLPVGSFLKPRPGCVLQPDLNH